MSRKRRRAGALAPRPATAPAPEAAPTRLLDRWWVALLAAAWVIGIVVIYYWLQSGRLVEVLTR